MQPTKPIAAALTCFALLAGAPAAIAENPAREGYSRPGGAIQEQVDTDAQRPAQRAPAPDDEGAVPFTGLDVAMVAAVALLLIALGAALRRHGHRELTNRPGV